MAASRDTLDSHRGAEHLAAGGLRAFALAPSLALLGLIFPLELVAATTVVINLLRLTSGVGVFALRGHGSLASGGRPASRCLLRLLERVEALLDALHAAGERIDRAQPRRDVAEPLVYSVHNSNDRAARQVHQPSEGVLAGVGESRDGVTVLLSMRPCHAETIARSA
jgi:hypothetical protein